MNRILLWTMSTLTVLVLLLGYRTSLAGPDLAAGAETPISGSVSTTEPATEEPATEELATEEPAAEESATRTVTGPAVETRYGPVQVELTVTGSGDTSEITHVSVLQYPHSDGTDAHISDFSLPVLIEQTIDLQSADVDMVSGATSTSAGYRSSLQAALDEARS